MDHSCSSSDDGYYVLLLTRKHKLNAEYIRIIFREQLLKGRQLATY